MSRRTAWLWIGAISVLTLAAYANSFHGAYVYDDMEGIKENLSIRSWATLFHPAEGTTASGRPLLNLSLGLSYAISGVRPWGYHLINVIVQMAAGLALFGWLRRTHPKIAGPAALVWAVHPVLTESVTYLVQRAESMMGLFYILTFYCFARRSKRWEWLSVICCYAGMATKEVMVTAPVLVLLYDRTFVSGSFKAAWRARRTYYLALASSWLLLAALVASTGGNRSGTIGFGIGISPLAYALTQFRALWTYLRLAVWPHPLIIDYGPLWVHRAADVVPYAVPVLAAFGLTLWALARRPILGFWGAWFFLILSPTSSIIPGTTQIIVEHRMYLSLIAALVVAILGLERWARRWTTAILSVIAVLFAVLTFERNEVYGSEARVWTETVAEAPDNPNAHDALGLVLLREGKMDQAMDEYRTARRLSPDLVAPLENIGDAEVKQGRYQAAFETYQLAIQKNPNYAPVRVDLGNLYLQSGQIEEAIAQYQDALRIKSSSAEAHDNWGLALIRSGHASEAIAHLQAALKIKPDFAEAQFNWGNAMRIMGQPAAAMAHYERALRLKPEYAEAALNLGNLFMQQDRLPEAIARFREALKGQPDSPDAHNSLGLALARSGDLPHAIAECETALRLRPDFPAARTNIILFRRQAGMPE